MRRRALLLAPILAALACSPAAATTWRAPTNGSVTRGFAVGPDPFARGQHRGADFAAIRGAPVRAACSGRVVVATRIGSSGGVVTVVCGPWRVSHMPLARITIRTGASTTAGDPIGTAAPTRAHEGVHLGVRRAGTRFGYVDPLRFIRPTNPPPPAGPAGRKLQRRRPAPGGEPVGAPQPAHGEAATAAGQPSPAAASRPLAPWPAWLALAGLLIAAAGGARVRTRPRRAHAGAARARVASARHHLPP